MDASQSAPGFSSQGTDQAVRHFKGCLSRKILLVHWNICFLKNPTPEKTGIVSAHYVTLLEMTLYFLKPLSWKKKILQDKLSSSLPVSTI